MAKFEKGEHGVKTLLEADCNVVGQKLLRSKHYPFLKFSAVMLPSFYSAWTLPMPPPSFSEKAHFGGQLNDTFDGLNSSFYGCLHFIE